VIIPPSAYSDRNEQGQADEISSRQTFGRYWGIHKTSVSLEDEFWTQLREIAGAKQATVSQLLAQIDERRDSPNLSSAIRVYILEHFRNSADFA
jgi:predicted DNA-binding ribbon-helix-helix protein